MKNMVLELLFFVLMFSLIQSETASQIIQDSLHTKQILLPEEFSIKDRIHLSSFDRNVYALYPDASENDGLSLNLFSSVQNNVSLLPINDEIKEKLQSWEIISFALNNSHLCFHYGKNIALYQHSDFTDFCLDSIFELPERYENMYLFGNELILATCDFRLTPSKKVFTSVCCFDLAERKIKYQKELPKPNGGELTVYQPKNLIDVSRNRVAVADVINYRVSIYSLDSFRLISKVETNKFDNDIKGYVDFIERSDRIYNTRSYISALSPYHDEFAQIHKIFLLNDSTLLVYRTADDKKHIKTDYLFDVWKFSYGKWYLKIEDAVNLHFKPDKEFDEINAMYIGNNFICRNNRILHIEPVPFIITEGKSSHLTLKDIKEKVEKYMIDKGPRYSVFVEEFIYGD